MKLLNQAIYVIYVLAKTIKTRQNQYTDLLRFLFIEDSLKIKKEFCTSFQATFFIEIFDKTFSFVMLNKLAKFHHQTVFLPKLFSKMCFVFRA